MTADPPAKTLLVIRPTGLGDLVMALPALRALRRAHPARRLITTCPPGLVPLARLAGVADRFISGPSGEGAGDDPSLHRGTNQAILDQLFAEPEGGTDEAIVILKMPEDELSRRALARRPGQLVCYRHPDVAGTADQPGYVPEDHVLGRWERLLAPSGVLPDIADLYLALPEPEDPGQPRQPDPPVPTVLHLGAGSQSRRWPADRWAVVAAALSAEGHRVVFSGSRAERELVGRVAMAAGLPGTTNLAGRTDTVQLASLVRSARLVVSTDTGVPHLATLFARPSVTIFGPTSPREWGPPAGSHGHRVLWAGRIGTMYGPDPDPGLLLITPADVLAAARSLTVG